MTRIQAPRNRGQQRPVGNDISTTQAARPRAGLREIDPGLRTIDASAITGDLGIKHTFALTASNASSGVTEVYGSMDGLLTLEVGVPVAVAMTADVVAVSWTSNNAPSGDWTATLEKRSGGGWSDVATFSITTS